MPPLKNQKHERLVQEYLIDLNKTRAGIRAGYSSLSAAQQASEIFKIPKVHARVEELLAERSRRTGITADRVLRELARVAFINPAEVVDFVYADVLDSASTDDLAAIASIKVKTSTFGENGSSTEREVKFYDKLKALDQLCKHLGIGNGSGAGGDDEDNNTGVVELPAVMASTPPPDLSEPGEGDGHG